MLALVNIMSLISEVCQLIVNVLNSAPMVHALSLSVPPDPRSGECWCSSGPPELTSRDSPRRWWLMLESQQYFLLGAGNILQGCLGGVPCRGVAIPPACAQLGVHSQ